MGQYRKLRVWQHAYAVTLSIYTETRRWPSDERYGLISQIRRAAASIGANLAEGSGRKSNAELARYARMALGSANEVEYDLHLARDLGYMKQEVAHRLLAEISDVQRMLAGLETQLRPVWHGVPTRRLEQRKTNDE